MKTFTIENETNNIIGHATKREAGAVPDSERFSSETELSEVAAGWPTARLIEIWNSLPGVTPVNKFKDRKTAVGRIWKAIQNIGESGAPETDPHLELAVSGETSEIAPIAQPELIDEVAETGDVSAGVTEFDPETPFDQSAPEAPQTPDVAPAEPRTKNKATRAKKAHKRAAGAKGSRQGSKTATVLALLKQEGGTGLNAIMEATGWQAHSVRGFLSGTIGKKMKLEVLSTKGENGARNYLIKA